MVGQMGSENGSLHRVVLRLDDGSLVGPRTRLKQGDAPTPAVRLDVAKAYEIGRLGPEQVLRMEQLVFRMEALVHGDAWVDEPLGGKRKAPDLGFQEYGNGDPKRARSVAHAANGGNGVAGLLAGSPSLPSQGSWGVADWEGKGLEVISTLLSELGPEAPIFANPVDGTKVRDYYRIVKKPMDLGTMQGKLKRNEYRNPSEFYEDMMLVWTNAFLYNKKGDYVHKLAVRCEASFQRLWSSSGLCASAHRARRTNAGVAAEKYEPAEMLPPEKKRANTGIKAPTRAASGAVGIAASKPTRSRQPPAHHMDRLQSTDSLKAPPRRKAMTQEQLQELALALQTLDSEVVQGAIDIIREASGTEGEVGDGEVELDFDTLDTATLWKLHEFVASNSAAAAAAEPEEPAAVDGSESESDSESE